MSMAELRDEARMVASTVAGLLFGRTVWLPEEEAPDTKWIDATHKRNITVVRDIYQDRLKSESEGVESVRRRAEFALTAIIAAVGLSAGAFERLWAVTPDSPWPLIIWIIGVLIVVLSILIFGGVAVSKKVLGVVDVKEFAHLKDGQREELRQYVWATYVTSRTRRAMVTVFRDGFLIALLGLVLLAVAHAVSWAAPLDDAPAPVVVNIISPSPTP
ncbi:hypothetical protein [Protaetiibacter intestinalis]|uniref:hypothetical protein n=1 Tax=Protaetiibacter intestinalis TaxID=2419774 RepID=UPI0013003671|nr:hypothetical protein [Protaetiibacter intestinalis]